MAYSDVSICNLALTHLGDKAAVVSISAPTTAQEQYCATYYPIARDLLLEGHCWNFNTVRKALVVSSVTPPSTWQYCYDLPTNLMRLLAILDPNAADDYSSGVNFSNIGAYSQPTVNLGVETPYDYVQEWDEASGKQVIYTDLASAVGRYTIPVTDPTKWQNDFVMALSYQLASFLAGPILKGDIGSKMSGMMESVADKWTRRSEGGDANERKVIVSGGAPWIQGR